MDKTTKQLAMNIRLLEIPSDLKPNYLSRSLWRDTRGLRLHRDIGVALTDPDRLRGFYGKVKVVEISADDIQAAQRADLQSHADLRAHFYVKGRNIYEGRALGFVAEGEEKGCLVVGVMGGRGSHNNSLGLLLAKLKQSGVVKIGSPIQDDGKRAVLSLGEISDDYYDTIELEGYFDLTLMNKNNTRAGLNFSFSISGNLLKALITYAPTLSINTPLSHQFYLTFDTKNKCILQVLDISKQRGMHKIWGDGRWIDKGWRVTPVARNAFSHYLVEYKKDIMASLEAINQYIYPNQITTQDISLMFQHLIDNGLEFQFMYNEYQNYKVEKIEDSHVKLVNKGTVRAFVDGYKNEVLGYIFSAKFDIILLKSESLTPK